MEFTHRDEQEIVDLAKIIDDSSICFYPAESEIGHRALSSLRGETLAQRERPDFADLRQSLLLEAMIVDDHAGSGKKDATRNREGAILRELRESGFAETVPNASLTAIVDTRLPTEKDHNYRSYLAHFASVVGNHAKKAGEYRAEHPGFDLGFLILDESAAYFESLGAFGAPGRGRPHLHFSDKAFMDVLLNAQIDYVAWLTPYKLVKTDEGILSLPEMTIIDVRLLDQMSLDSYEPRRMMSADA